jgi:hypothetical protein
MSDENFENKLRILLELNKNTNSSILTKKIIELLNSKCPGCKMIIEKDENGISKTNCGCYGF